MGRAAGGGALRDPGDGGGGFWGISPVRRSMRANAGWAAMGLRRLRGMAGAGSTARANGFNPRDGRRSNVSVMLRPDGRFEIVPRSGAIMISSDGILGPYLQSRVNSRVKAFLGAAIPSGPSCV